MGVHPTSVTDPTSVRALLDLRGLQPRPGGHNYRGGIQRYFEQLLPVLVAQESLELHALVHGDRPLPRGALTLAADHRLHVVGDDLGAGFDVVHTAVAFDLGQPYSGARLARARSAGQLVTAFDAIPLLPEVEVPAAVRRAWYHRAEILRRADLVLAISAEAADQVIRAAAVDPSRVLIVGTGAPVGRAKLEPASLPGLRFPYLVYTGGTVDPRKNVRRLIDAFAKSVAGRDGSTQLVLASHTDPTRRADLESHAERCGVGDRVLVTGWVDDDVLVALLQHAQALIYPSFSEGFGLPVVEAMAAGTPVIASNSAAVRHVHGHPEATFDPRSEDSMVSTIDRVWGDASLRRRLRDWGARRVEQYAWEGVAERTATAYRAVAVRRSGGPTRGVRSTTSVIVGLGSVNLGSPAASAALVHAAAGGEAGLCTPDDGFDRVVVDRVPLRHVDEADRVVLFVDGAESLPTATAIATSVPTIALLPELDRLLGAPELHFLVGSAQRVGVRDEIDAWRLRRSIGRHAPVVIVPPPDPWPPAVYDPASEPLLALRPERRQLRASRPRPVLVALQPLRFGPMSNESIMSSVGLAAATGSRLEIIGAADRRTVQTAVATWYPAGRNSRVSHRRSLGEAELVATLTSADALLSLDREKRSAGEAVGDLASSLGVVHITAHEGQSRQGRIRLTSADDLRGAVEALARAVAEDAAPEGAGGRCAAHTVWSMIGSLW